MRGLTLLRGQVGRLVGVHEDLVEDHRALGVDVGGPQRRLPHDLAQDVEPEWQVLGQQADVEGGVLLGGEGVAVTTDLVEGLGDGDGRTGVGALEEQMLEEVRCPGQFVALVREPDAHPVGRPPPSGHPPWSR